MFLSQASILFLIQNSFGQTELIFELFETRKYSTIFGIHNEVGHFDPRKLRCLLFALDFCFSCLLLIGSFLSRCFLSLGFLLGSSITLGKLVYSSFSVHNSWATGEEWVRC